MVVPMRSRAWPAWALLVAGCAAGALGARAESVEAFVARHWRVPLAEQAPPVPGALARNPAFDPALRARGIPCAACHVRGHERFGPPRRDGSLASAAPRETLPHNGVTRTPAFLKAEF